MDELFPALIFFILWIVFAGSIGKRSKKKGTGNSGPARSQKPIARPGAAKAPGNLSSFLKQPPGEASPHTGSVLSPESSAPWGSLGADDPEGTDPCHDDPSRMPSGSLRVNVPEGTDPCHDDPSRVPSGSLNVNIAEGTDPCHPDTRKPAVRTAAPSAAQETAGFQPGFSANDVVRGFVWGEILNRKRA